MDKVEQNGTRPPLLQVMLEPEVHKAFAIACLRLGTTKSDVIRAYVKQFIEQHAEQEVRAS